MRVNGFGCEKGSAFDNAALAENFAGMPHGSRQDDRQRKLRRIGNSPVRYADIVILLILRIGNIRRFKEGLEHRSTAVSAGKHKVAHDIARIQNAADLIAVGNGGYAVAGKQHLLGNTSHRRFAIKVHTLIFRAQDTRYALRRVCREGLRHIERAAEHKILVNYGIGLNRNVLAQLVPVGDNVAAVQVLRHFHPRLRIICAFNGR